MSCHYHLMLKYKSASTAVDSWAIGANGFQKKSPRASPIPRAYATSRAASNRDARPASFPTVGASRPLDHDIPDNALFNIGLSLLALARRLALRRQYIFRYKSN
ncbi:MAG TPA: hypothetical protein VE710_03495 [Candidatus Bathyarchaeia archaeon]|nr:hypothetical protein [Candidatus Bathyarchaeia archaeon]